MAEPGAICPCRAREASFPIDRERDSYALTRDLWTFAGIRLPSSQFSLDVRERWTGPGEGVGAFHSSRKGPEGAGLPRFFGVFRAPHQVIRDPIQQNGACPATARSNLPVFHSFRPSVHVLPADLLPPRGRPGLRRRICAFKGPLEPVVDSGTLDRLSPAAAFSS